VTTTVVLTREAGRNDELRHALEGSCRVLEVPLTATLYRTGDDVARDVEALAAKTPFATVAFTSPRGAAIAALVVARVPGCALAAAGALTAAALRVALGEQTEILTPTTPGGRALGEAIVRGPVLVVGAALPSRALDDALAARFIEVSRVASYETRPVALGGLSREELRIGDVVLIGAPSTWAVAAPEIRRTAIVIVPGETTRAAVAESHERVVVADHASVLDVVRQAIKDMEAVTGS
jgi:uroporphyrinogen-III synthase